MIGRDTESTVVVFRKWRDGGDVLALFPGVPAGRRLCSSYQHVGQHGGADYSSCISRTRPAKPGEYAELKRELEAIGYSLVVKRRWVRR